MLYSSSRGTSGDMDKDTWADRHRPPNCDKSRTYHIKLEKVSRQKTTYHSLEFTSWHLDDSRVVGPRNAEVHLVKTVLSRSQRPPPGKVTRT